MQFCNMQFIFRESVKYFMPQTKQKQKKFNQPIGDFKARKLIIDEEAIEYLPGYKYRVWHNNQPDNYPSHRHPAIEIILCTKNTYTVCVEDKTFHLREGDILFIPPSVSHQLIAPDTGERFILLFDTDFLNLFTQKDSIEEFFSTTHMLSMGSETHYYPFVYSSISKIIQIYFANDKMSEVAIYSEVFRIISYLCGSEEAVSEDEINTHSDVYNKFVRVLSYIEENYAEDLSLESVASTAGFSKFHFARLFKQYTDTTFYDYLCTKRIVVSKNLLRKSIPVTEVAFQTGFNNLTTFSRCFKKYVGCSPSQYKSQFEHDESSPISFQSIQ